MDPTRNSPFPKPVRAESAEIRSVIESLRADMAELRRASTSEATRASAAQLAGSPSPPLMEVPVVVEVGPLGNPSHA
ncbi:hypothetical protein MRX96_003620 [Rhipicephalus microplus]